MAKSDKQKASYASDFDELLDDALGDFVPQNAPPSEPDHSPRAISLSKTQGLHPLPDRSSKKVRKTPGLKFAPLPDRKKQTEPAPKKSTLHLQDEDGHDQRTLPGIPEADGDLYQDFAKLMQELHCSAANAEQDSRHPAHKGDLSETLREMAQQSAEIQSSGKHNSGQRAMADGPSGEPTFAGLQEEFGGSERGFGGLADSLMRQLLSKDVLYQPMKDIGDRYPEWLAAHRDALSPEEMRQYEEQYRHINQILDIYNNDPENFSELFSALQQMQACGQPPQDIVNDLAPGMAFDDEGLPKGLPGTAGAPLPGCSIQ